MIRRFNYTGRVSIPRDCVQVLVRKEKSGATSFRAELKLEELGLEEASVVVAEAYRKTTWRRFDLGAIAELDSSVEWPLEGIEDIGDLRFRIKVLGSDGTPGLLLAEADRLSPSLDDESPREALSLLPVRSANLGQKIWELSFADDHVTLLVNRELNREQLLATPDFRGQALPAILREILTRFLFVDCREEDDDGDSAASNWFRFARMLTGESELPDRSDLQERLAFIDQVVEHFCTKAGFLNAVLREQGEIS